MNIKSLIKTLNGNQRLTRNAILHYLSLLYLATVNPYGSDAYLATKVTEKELLSFGLLAGSISDLNDVLAKEGLIKKLEEQSLSIYILGEKHVVDTLSGKRIAEAWYFDQPEVEIIEHGEKVRASKAKTYNEEINEIIDFYYWLYNKKYKTLPAIDYSKTRKALKNVFKQFPFEMVKACIPIYLDLEDEYLQNRHYPLSWLLYKLVDCQIQLQEKIAYYGMQNKQEEFFERYIEKIIKDKKLTDHEDWLAKKDGGIIAKEKRTSGQCNQKPEGGGQYQAGEAAKE